MQIHHDKHHAAYVTNLNSPLEKHPAIEGKSLEALLMDLNAVPAEFRTAVRNHGGGTWNHDLFWLVMAPKAGGEPQGGLATAISIAFGTLPVSRPSLKRQLRIVSVPAGLGWSRREADWQWSRLPTRIIRYPLD